MARKPTDIVQLKLRFSEALRRGLERAAARNNRSMNTEIIHRLQESLAREGLIELRGDFARQTGPMSEEKSAELLGKIDRLLELLEPASDDGDNK
jgi:hypothetical protein